MKAAAGTTYTIIIEDDHNGHRHATPSPLLVKGFDAVIFYNKTQEPIKIQFSHTGVFGTSQIPPIPGGDSTQALPVLNPPDLIVCPYAVWCTDLGEFAHGSAMPIIIVDPKD